MNDAADRPVRRVLQVLLPAQFLLSVGYGVLFALLAAIQDEFALPTTALGVISGATFVTSLVAQLVFARYADRGHARLLLLVGLAAAGLSLLWFGAATEMWEFVLARSIQGAGIGCFLPAARALVVTAEPGRAGRNLGLLTSIDLAGIVLGPVVGALLAQAVSLSTPFFALAAGVAVAFVFLLVVGRRLPESSGTGGGRHSLRRLLRRRRVVGVAILALALEFPTGVYDALWARYLTDRGASETFIGFSLTAFGIPFILFATTGGRLADRHGALRVALWGAAIVVPATFLYGLLAAPILILVVSVVESMGMTISVPGTQAAMAEASPPDLVASGQGLALAAGIGGAGVAAFVAAPVYQAYGPAWLFAGTAVLVAVLATVGAVVARSGGPSGGAFVDPAQPVPASAPG